MGADADESQIVRDVENLIAGLERELEAANRHRLALEARHNRAVRAAFHGSFPERRLLGVLRRLAFVGALVLTFVVAGLWSYSAILGMAAIPAAPVVLLAVVLSTEHVIRRRHRMYPAPY